MVAKIDPRIRAICNGKGFTMNFYRAMRGLLRLALGVYFRRIETFHADRIPLTGPVLFTSNHPNSLSDSFVLGTSVPRKVHFVATVQLFKFAPLKRFLLACGVIPINRVKDDPRGMRSVLETFEACYRVLERGEAVGIFPEGITHDAPALKEIKTGAARMALELEQRHAGKLGLKLVPVGLTFGAKDRYRSDAVANFGEPILVADFLQDYDANRHERIRELTAALAKRMQQLIVHLPQLEHARVVESVRRLYVERLEIGRIIKLSPVLSPLEELELTRKITRSVDFIYAKQPERAAAFVRELDHYQHILGDLKLHSEDIASLERSSGLVTRLPLVLVAAVLLAPVALYGWIHRLIPVVIVRAIVERFRKTARNETPVATTRIVAGLFVFGAFYALYVFIFQRFFDWTWTVWYAASLPLTGILAHYYVERGGIAVRKFRALIIRFRAGTIVEKLKVMRQHLLDEIDAVRERVPWVANKE